MSGAGLPLGEGMLNGWEWLVTSKELDRETVMRWALSVHSSKKLVVTRRANKVGSVLLEGFENIIVEASVFSSENRQLDSRRWKTKGLCADLEQMFEGKLSYETLLTI